MRIAFAGTPAFAATGLAALLDAGFEVCLVLSQPDRPSGRGQHLQASAVKNLAVERGIAVLTPPGLRPERAGVDATNALEQLRAAAPDILVVAAYGLLLPEAVLQLPRGFAIAGASTIRAINIHASLLPRWRGAAPVIRAIEAGDRRTGITIMQMDAGLDTGPILLAQAVDIDPLATGGSLTAELAQLGGRLVVAALHQLALGSLHACAQPSEGVAYATKIAKREAWIDWRQPAHVLEARMRAFDPFPGACSSLLGRQIKIWRARVPDPAPSGADSGAAPGTVLASGPEGIVVACGDTALQLIELQRPGGRRLGAAEFVAGSPVPPGARWSTPPGATDER